MNDQTLDPAGEDVGLFLVRRPEPESKPVQQVHTRSQCSIHVELPSASSCLHGGRRSGTAVSEESCQ